MSKKIYSTTINRQTLFILASGKNEAINHLVTALGYSKILSFAGIENLHPNQWSSYYVTDPNTFTFDADIPDEEKHLYDNCELIIETFKKFAEREEGPRIIKTLEI